MVAIKSMVTIAAFLTLFGVVSPLCTTLAQSNETAIPTNETFPYDNPNLGFTLEYPSDWTKDESITFVSPMSETDEAPESISITTEIIPTNLTLGEYSNSALRLLEEQFPDFTLLELVNSTLSGFPAQQIVYTYTQDGTELKLMQIWAVADGTVYALTYGGIPAEFNDALPDFQSMVDSFEIKGLGETKQEQTFRSAFDTFVTSEPEGYGMYQERGSNVFEPGETMVLYIEPVGFRYSNLTDDQGNQLYSINFDASFAIYDKDGNVVLEPVNAPIPQIVSHYKNKEVFIPFTITQSSPFPPGEYMIKYSILDENSGNVFELDKNITISGGNSNV